MKILKRLFNDKYVGRKLQTPYGEAVCNGKDFTGLMYSLSVRTNVGDKYLCLSKSMMKRIKSNKLKKHGLYFI